MTALAPQRAPGLVGRQLDRTPQSGVAAPQPTIFIREDGAKIEFTSIAEFTAWRWPARTQDAEACSVETIGN
jgi:hypothetical protein